MKRVLLLAMILVGLARAVDREAPTLVLKDGMLVVSCPNGTLHISGQVTTKVNTMVPMPPAEKHRYAVAGLEVLKSDGSVVLYCGDSE
jgi:hypothetical protein